MTVSARFFLRKTLLERLPASDNKAQTSPLRPFVALRQFVATRNKLLRDLSDNLLSEMQQFVQQMRMCGQAIEHE